MGMVRLLREQSPGKGLIAERQARYREREAEKNAWRVRAEMEELVVRKGGNRVLFMRGRLDLNTLGLQGMGLGNFDQLFRHELLSLRDAEWTKRKETAAVAAAENVDAAVEEVAVEGQMNKITEYFSLPRQMVDEQVVEDVLKKAERVSDNEKAGKPDQTLSESEITISKD